MKKYDNREEMKRILLAGNLNSNNDDSWNVRHILDGATPDFAFHGYKIHSGASKLCLCNEGGEYVCKWVTDDRYNEAVQETRSMQRRLKLVLRNSSLILKSPLKRMVSRLFFRKKFSIL